MTNDTEDAIGAALDRELGTSTDTSGAETTASTTENPQAEGTGTKTASEATGATEKTSTSSVTDSNIGGAEQKQEKSAGEVASKKAGNPADLIDPATGQVLAKAGAERRHYERGHAAARKEYIPVIDKMETELKAFREANRHLSEMQLSPQEALAGAQLVAALKNNPVETLKILLTNARASGHTIEDIGATTDLKAFEAIIDQRLKPFMKQIHEEEAQTTAITKAQETWDNFSTQHPEAVLHEDILAQLIREGGMDLQSAYYELRLAAAQHNLDFAKPLGPQWATRQAQTKSTQTAPVSENRQSLPSARAGAGVITTTTPIAPAHESNRDIVAAAMREAGINF